MNRCRILTKLLCGAATLVAAALLLEPWRSPNGLSTLALDHQALGDGWEIPAGSVAPPRQTAPTEPLSIAPNAQGRVAVAAPDLNLSADRCPTATLSFAAEKSSHHVSCTFAWRRAGDPNDYRVRCVRVDDPFAAVPRVEFAALDLPVHPAWKGRICRIEWTLDGVNRPLQRLSLDLPAARGGETVAMLWRQWWHREPIGPATINTIRAPHVLGYSPNALLVLALVLAAGAYGLIASTRRRDFRPAVLLTLVLAAWLLNDARWAWAQTRQYPADRERFGGADSADLESRLWPQAIARMAELARVHLPPGAVYAVIGGNLVTAAADSTGGIRHYGDSRLRYLLSPRWVQVNLDPLQPHVPPQQARFLLVLDRRLVEIDAATGTVRAPGWPPAVHVADDPAAGILIARMDGA